MLFFYLIIITVVLSTKVLLLTATTKRWRVRRHSSRKELIFSTVSSSISKLLFAWFVVLGKRLLLLCFFYLFVFKKQSVYFTRVAVKFEILSGFPFQLFIFSCWTTKVLKVWLNLQKKCRIIFYYWPLNVLLFSILGIFWGGWWEETWNGWVTLHEYYFIAYLLKCKEMYVHHFFFESRK